MLTGKQQRAVEDFEIFCDLLRLEGTLEAMVFSKLESDNTLTEQQKNDLFFLKSFISRMIIRNEIPVNSIV